MKLKREEERERRGGLLMASRILGLHENKTKSNWRNREKKDNVIQGGEKYKEIWYNSVEQMS